MPMCTWHNRAQLGSLESIEVVYRYALYALTIATFIYDGLVLRQK